MFYLPSFIVHAQAGTQSFEASGCMVDGVPTLKCVEVLFGNLLFMSSAIIILILFVMLLVGGFYYMTSFGDPEKLKKAQGTIKYAIFGLVLFVSAFLILKIIDTVFLGGCGKIFKFELPTGDVPSPTPGAPVPCP